MNTLLTFVGFALIVASFALGMNDHFIAGALCLIAGGVFVTRYGARLLDGGGQ